MNQREGIITLHGNPLTLVGAEIQPGQEAPVWYRARVK